LKDFNNSLKSENIRGGVLHGIQSKSNFSDCIHPLVNWARLPVSVLVRLHLFEIGVGANVSFHAMQYEADAPNMQVRVGAIIAAFKIPYPNSRFILKPRTGMSNYSL
jgi:hypothetical protein